MQIFDYCVIGTGIGGGSLIEKLPKNKSILIIEEGNAKDQKMSEYEVKGREFGVRTTTSIQLGGTSNLWHGVLAPLDKIDFEKRDYIPKSGWPITYKELEPYYRQAGKLLGLKDYSLFDDEHQFVTEQTAKLPLNYNLFKNKLFQQPEPPVNFKIKLLQKIESNPNITLLQNTSALEFVLNDNGEVENLKIGTIDGSVSSVAAKNYILAAGAIQSPKILLNSKINNQNVGRYFMDHPMANLTQVKFKKPQKAPIYSDMKSSGGQKIKSGIEMRAERLLELKLANHNFFLRPSFVRGINDESEQLKLSLLSFKDGKTSLSDIIQLLKNINVIRQILAYKFSLNVKYKYADLFFVTEQLPNPNSRVTLSSEKDKWGYNKSCVDWQLYPSEIEEMKKWFELVMSELLPRKLFEFTYSLQDFKWEERFSSAVHHVGTCRMAQSDTEGVVDRNLKVFGINNLYICDGSVFPTSGNVNSSFTISALACRLAEHLSKEN